MKKLIYIFVLSLGMSGCLLHPETNRAAFVIENQTNRIIVYQLYLSKKWSEPTEIENQGVEYALEYEEKNVNALPPGLVKIRITIHKCQFEIERANMKKDLLKDPSGRHGWNLVVNNSLLRKYHC